MVAPSIYNPPETQNRSPWRVIRDAVSTLQFKATALVVLLTLSVTATVSGYLMRSSGEFARENHSERLVQAASLLAKGIAATMETGDRSALQPLAVESSNGSPLLYVIVSDKDGNQLAAAQYHGADVLRKLQRDNQKSVPVPGTPVIVAKDESTPVFLDITYPITRRETVTGRARGRPTQLLGYVRTGMIAGDWERAMSNKMDLVVGVGILALFAAVPLGFMAIRRIVAPLDSLSDVILEFSQGKLDVRSPLTGTDEIGRLAQAFNQMADQHQQTHERIIRLNAELEERVAHRTHQLRELASKEPLTGLYNRRYFNETLDRRYSEAARYSGDLSCIMIDLDEFKTANDTFGHQVGDELLVLTAKTLLSELRSHDVAARFGGDEFIVLLPQTDQEQAASLGERIAERFKLELSERFPSVTVSMSVGIASLRGCDAADAEGLVRAADRALYEAKAAGKNQLRVAGRVSDAART